MFKQKIGAVSEAAFTALPKPGISPEVNSGRSFPEVEHEEATLP